MSLQDNALCATVGVTGFEPAAFHSQSGRATKLRHTPSPALAAYAKGPGLDWVPTSAATRLSPRRTQQHPGHPRA